VSFVGRFVSGASGSLADNEERQGVAVEFWPHLKAMRTFQFYSERPLRTLHGLLQTSEYGGVHYLNEFHICDRLIS
jgi:hypothetical protein